MVSLAATGDGSANELAAMTALERLVELVAGRVGALALPRRGSPVRAVISPGIAGEVEFVVDVVIPSGAGHWIVLEGVEGGTFASDTVRTWAVDRQAAGSCA
jgi:hypothetical protein